MKKVMRIDDINAMADSDIRENNYVEKLAEEQSKILGWGEYQGLSEQNGFKDAYINGYNKAKEDYEVVSSIREVHQYKLGLEDGYNKAKKTYKYTDEDVIKAIDMARLQGPESFIVKYREEEIIQSLKQN
jgi:hypothetical protein